MKVSLKNFAIASVTMYLFSFGLCTTKDFADSVIINLDKNNSISSFNYTIAAAPAGSQTTTKTLSYSALNDSLMLKSKNLTGTSYTLDDILNIKLNQVILTILSPSTVKFGIVDSASLILTAPSLSTLTVFEKKFLNVTSDSTATIDFSTVDFKPYIAATKLGGNITYALSIKTNAATPPISIKVVPTYSVELVAK